MQKSATDVMQDILFAAVTDCVAALKEASRGVPNTLIRDIAAIHPNATFADLPKEVQGAIAANVRAAFNRLLKEGYSVSPAGTAPERTTHHPRPAGPAAGPRQRPQPPRNRDAPGPGPRPGKPKPRGPRPR